MNEQNRNEIISEWCADVAPIAGHAQIAWTKYLNQLPDEHIDICLEAITNIADSTQDGHYKRSPNRNVFINEYTRLKNIKERNVSDYGKCSICNSTGLLSMVIAFNRIKGRQTPVPYQVAIPSGKADVVSTPCSCERGLNVTGPSFVKRMSEPSNPERYYTKEQIKRLATVCGYTSRAEAEVYRAKCESFYQAWIEKYPKKEVEQSIGYKGEKNQQVNGFFNQLERRYE